MDSQFLAVWEKKKALWLGALEASPVLPIKLHDFLGGTVKQAFMETFKMRDWEAHNDVRRMYWSLADLGLVLTNSKWMIMPYREDAPKEFYGGGFG